MSTISGEKQTNTNFVNNHYLKAESDCPLNRRGTIKIFTWRSVFESDTYSRNVKMWTKKTWVHIPDLLVKYWWNWHPLSQNLFNDCCIKVLTGLENNGTFICILSFLKSFQTLHIFVRCQITSTTNRTARRRLHWLCGTSWKGLGVLVSSVL